MQTRENKFINLQEENSIKLKKIDYVEFYVGNAQQAAYFYCQSFGFRAIAYAGLETLALERSPMLD